MFRIQHGVDFFFGEIIRDDLGLHEDVLQGDFLFVGFHAGIVDDVMGGEAAEFSGEVHHDTFAHHEALLEEEVLFHVVFVDDEILEDVPCFFKGGRREDEGSGQTFPFGDEAAPVSFVFRDHALDDGGRRGPDVPKKREDVFKDGRVSLVRHGGGADLPFEEGFFKLEDFRPLQSEYFIADAAHGACKESKVARKFWCGFVNTDK